jgi:hypothetical protein
VTDYRKNGSAVGGGGAGLPVATGAGEVPLSTGAGTTYVAANFGDEVGTAIAGGIGGTLGLTFIGDGAGSVQQTSADVSALLAAADAPAMRSALFPSTAISLASATGWSTTTAGGTTSVINTSTERAVLTVAAGTGTFTLASVARTTLPALGRYSIQARITSWTGVAATDTEQMLVRMTDSAATISDLWIYGTEAVSLTAAATVPAGAVTVAGLLAGQGWVRVTIDGAQITYACGVGSAGVAPTSWTTIGSRSTAAAIMHPYTSFGVQIRRTSAQVTDLVAELGTVSYRSLDL